MHQLKIKNPPFPSPGLYPRRGRKHIGHREDLEAVSVRENLIEDGSLAVYVIDLLDGDKVWIKTHKAYSLGMRTKNELLNEIIFISHILIPHQFEDTNDIIIILTIKNTEGYNFIDSCLLGLYLIIGISHSKFHDVNVTIHTVKKRIKYLGLTLLFLNKVGGIYIQEWFYFCSCLPKWGY